MERRKNKSRCRRGSAVLIRRGWRVVTTRVFSVAEIVSQANDSKSGVQANQA
jgi:hypothetical protein